MTERFTAETTDCELKETVERNKPRSWLKSVSAFANTSGGTILFGITDSQHIPTGLANPQQDADFISESIKQRIDPLPEVAIEILPMGMTSLISVRVLAGPNPPYYCNADGRREAFVRVGNQSVIAPRETLNSLILKGANQTWDGMDSGIKVSNASFSVLKAEFAYRQQEEPDEVDLESFGMITAHQTLTNAGALLADQPLIRNSRLFCTHFNGPGENDIADTAEFQGSLLALLREGQAFIQRKPGKRHHAEG